MTSRALLRTYRTVRDVVADIHVAVTAVDEHVGRYQIFGTKEDFAHAVAKAASLSKKIEELEFHLRRCAPMATDARAAERRSVQSSTVLSHAGVP
jgi:hypothetical protein